MVMFFLLIYSKRAFNEKAILKLAVLPPPEAKNITKKYLWYFGLWWQQPIVKGLQ
jgi:hypothetical protein